MTVASKIHGAGSVIGFMLLLFVPLLFGIFFFNNQNPTMGVMSIISFVLALIFFTLFVMSDKPEFKNTIIFKIIIAVFLCLKLLGSSATAMLPVCPPINRIRVWTELTHTTTLAGLLSWQDVMAYPFLITVTAA